MSTSTDPPRAAPAPGHAHIEARANRESRVAFRVKIGVTGHLWARDSPELRRGIARQLAVIREHFPPTEVTPVVFTVMTALAEGADRIVPEVALEALAEDGIQLEAVLPLSEADYMTDFADDTSCRQFRHLLRVAVDRTTVMKTDHATDDERVAGYVRAGEFIVDRCDVLLAIWDGVDPHRKGGTAATVMYADKHHVPVVQVRPDGETLPPPPAFRKFVRYRDARRAFDRVDKYNRPLVTGQKLSGDVRELRERLEEALGTDSPVHAHYERVAAWALPHQARADVLARRYQRRYRILATIVHMLAALAVAAVAAQTVFAHAQPGWLAFEVALVGGLLVAVMVGRRGQIHDAWIGYRSLAEAFRSGLFLTLSGRQDRRDGISHSLGASRQPWFQRAFTEIWRQRPKIKLTEEEARAVGQFLITAWIEHQLHYHDTAAHRHARRRSRFTWTIAALSVVTITVALLHIFVVPHTSKVADWLEFLAISLPGFGAALTGLREHGQHRLHEDRSRRTAGRLGLLRDQSAWVTTPAEVRHLASQTQRLIAEESLDWWGAIEFQELEIVI